MPRDVFISHSAQDKKVAETICAALEESGIQCWVAPRDVRPGKSFPGEITRAIQQSKVMLLIFSTHSNSSEQVLREVQREFYPEPGPASTAVRVSGFAFEDLLIEIEAMAVCRD